jgi:hypothetical protein
MAVSQNVAIENPMQRVFYQWTANPVKVVVENTPCSKVVVTVDRGRLEGSGCDLKYYAEDTTINKVVMKIGIKTNGKIKWVANEISPVKRYQIFQPRMGCRINGDSIFKEWLYMKIIDDEYPAITFICEDFIIVGDGYDACHLTSPVFRTF